MPMSPQHWGQGRIPRIVRALVMASVVASGTASAQAPRNADVSRFRPSLDRDGYFGAQGTSTPGPWRFDAGLWFSYAYKVLRGNLGGTEADLIRHRMMANAQFQLGLGSRFALALDLPVLLHQSGDVGLLGGSPSLTSQGLGDLRILARARVFGRDAAQTRERNDGLGIAVLAGASLPTGDEDAFVGEGAVTTDLQAIASYYALDIGASLMLGWRHRFQPRDLGALRLRDQLLFSLGIQVPVPTVRGLLVRFETQGALDAGDPFGTSVRTSIEGILGAAYRTEQVTYSLGVGTGFSRGLGTPLLRVVFGMSFSPRMPDSDGDGIADSVDTCPHLPEDFDGFEDEDGCLDPDNDNDFVADEDDRCPNEEALEGQDEDEDGCTDP